MLICDLVGKPLTRAGIVTLRDDIDELLDILDDAEITAAALPHRQKYLMLTIGFLRRLLELHLDWIDEAERELTPNGKRTARQTT
jgi:hypothetical protein